MIIFRDVDRLDGDSSYREGENTYREGESAYRDGDYIHRDIDVHYLTPEIKIEYIFIIFLLREKNRGYVSNIFFYPYEILKLINT